METLRTYTQNLVSFGKNFFSKQDAVSALGITETQFRHQAYRLAKKLIIRRLHDDFYMIIPGEYRSMGSLPPQQIVGPLMRFLGLDYYIALLSAASYYGATEQQPMVFQVIVGLNNNPRPRAIKLPRGNIEFHVKKTCGLSKFVPMNVPTGYVNRATAEQTMVDLVAYYGASGGLSNVALVIKELGSSVQTKAFAEVVSLEHNKAVLQRLGYLLELTNQSVLADLVDRELSSKKRIDYIYLRPDYYKREGERVVRWKIILNDYVEFE